MDTALEVRDVVSNPALYGQVLDIYHEAFPPEERFPDADMLALAQRPGVHFLAFCTGEVVEGFSYLIETPHYLYVLFLAAEQCTRSRGVGSRMLAYARHAFAGKVQVLEIEPLDPDAENAQQRIDRLRFYERNGFAPAGCDSFEGDMRYTVLYTPAPSGAAASGSQGTEVPRGQSAPHSSAAVSDSQGTDGPSEQSSVLGAVASGLQGTEVPRGQSAPHPSAAAFDPEAFVAEVQAVVGNALPMDLRPSAV